MKRFLAILGFLSSFNTAAFAEEPTWKELGAISLQKLEKLGGETKSLAQEALEDLKVISKETTDQIQEKWEQHQAEKQAEKEMLKKRDSI